MDLFETLGEILRPESTTTVVETINLNLLKHSWTATVELNNGQIENIWYTAWPSTKRDIKNVISVSSDYPKRSIQ